MYVIVDGDRQRLSDLRFDWETLGDVQLVDDFGEPSPPTCQVSFLLTDPKGLRDTDAITLVLNTSRTPREHLNSLIEWVRGRREEMEEFDELQGLVSEIDDLSKKDKDDNQYG